jgi:ATP-dependent Clp protease ATP-binding subunit ClpA
MNFSIPVYVQAVGVAGEPARRYTVRPLFFARPQRRHENLNRAMSLLADDLRRHLHELGKCFRHDELAAYSFCPELEYHRLDLVLDLRRTRPRCRFLFVTFAALGRKLAFTPSLPELWFEVGRGEKLEARAAEVLARHFREQERDEEENFVSPEKLSLEGKAWVATLELEDVHPAQVVAEPEDRKRLALGETPVRDGEAELARVGRCLDRLYPDELDRVLFRDAEVAELRRLLRADDRRPVLLVGPRLVGKTAVLHEYVYQTVAARKAHHQFRENVWLLSPQRLISGMSYVGQWENRLLAILKAAGKHDHVLYFDDLLGLYHAGVTSTSSLNVAHVLKPYVERRAFRLLGEITPEAFRVFREQDRSFADLFHLLPVKEPGEEENLRVLISVQRQLEARHRCRFGLEVLPAVLDLQRRYVRGVSFPGKAALFLRRLAVKGRLAGVSRANVLDEFHAQSGLALTFLDSRARLERRQVIEALGRTVIGQDAALEAAADVIAVAKARLNDPDRPLASFLFLGPTGVGKTQCAKSLAGYLFGDPDKVLRFDMNEFVEPGSAARLVGTFGNPEGLLTSAVRRRPFAVVLLDEIEKAHPEVFDLLLQVLGEGRLTDALGRTVDFSNTLVVLTSNLGVREAQSGLGFQREGGDEGVYVRAAEKFFRPEFFNRLDRIVPFARLAREDVQKIARLLIQEVFQREGLVRRRCLLRVEEGALDRVVDLGYDPVLGARALKRAIERQLTQPVAARLAATLPEALTVVSLYPGADLIAVQVEALTNAVPVPQPDFRDVPAVLAGVEAVLRRIEDQSAPLRPEGEITRGMLRPEHFRYFALQEQAERVRERSRRIAEQLEDRKRSGLGPPAISLGSPPRPGRAKLIYRYKSPDILTSKPVLQEIAAAKDIHEFFESLAADTVPCGDKVEDQAAELLRQTALLDLMAGCGSGAAVEQVLMIVQPLNQAGQSWAELLADLYRKTFNEELGLETADVPHEHNEQNLPGLVVKGLHALPLAKVEEGTHLIFPVHENFVPVRVVVLPLADGVGPAAALAEYLGDRQRWLQLFAAGKASADEDPGRLLPVLRLYEEKGSTVDLRSGLLAPTPPPPESWRTFVLAALPLPAEARPGSSV